MGHQKFKFLLECIAIILLGTSDIGKCDGSRIRFENGLYNDISIAINKNVNQEDCNVIVAALTAMFSESSEYLSEVTQRPAAFGTVRILIPSIWDRLKCTGVQDAGIRDSYETADIKVSTNHPIAMNLPWAEQQGGCGTSAHTMYIPPYFLTNFTDQDRGRIFTHEWLKYRYGVFEEFGFLDDEFYLPCYEKAGNIYFTACTTPVLPPLSGSISGSLTPSECQTLITSNAESLKNQLSAVNSSLLFSPLRLNPTEKISGTCSNTTHNWFANTKQNIHCYRKSSSAIIMSHKDFQNNPLTKQNVGQDKAAVALKIELVHHRTRVDHGYAFVIENTTSIRQFNRLNHVKQSIAEFIQLIDNKNVMVATLTYDESFNVLPDIGIGMPMDIPDNYSKENFLRSIPDPDPMANLYKDSDFESVKEIGQKSLKDVFQTLESKYLNKETDLKWNIIFITSLPPVNLPETLEMIKLTDYSISVITFDNNETWLQWNSIPQTRKVLHLPACFDENSNAICSATTSTLLTDHLLEILSSKSVDLDPNQPFYQKIVELEINGNEAQKSFQIPPLSGNKDISFFLPVYSTSITAPTITSGSNGQPCVGQPVLNYPELFMFSSEPLGPCAFQSGTWTLNLNDASSNPNVAHTLRGFVKSDVAFPQQDLMILSSFDTDLSKQIYFSTQNVFVPLHITVKTKDDNPVVNANVQVEIMYTGNDTRPVKTILTLKDNGMDPDTTKDDGVYSGFIKGFSPTPSYHSGSIHVTTSGASSSIVKLSQANKAILLDPRMDEKCCGSYVPIDSTSSVQIESTYYSTTLHSFKTGDVIPNPSNSPPSRIEIITITQQTDSLIRLNFIAPGSNFDTGTVNHYDVCVQDVDLPEELCQTIKTNECLPVPGGGSQTCVIYKDELQSWTLNPAIREDKNPGDLVQIACHLRGVNNEGMNGPLSSYLIEIELVVSEEESAAKKCKTISDGCLPIEIFWILIACLAGVLLILIVVTCCWFWISRKEKKQQKSHQPKKEPKGNNNKGHGGTVGKSTRSKKDIKHLPFDNEFNSRGLYRSSFQNESPEMGTRSFPNNVRRRSNSLGEITTKFQPAANMVITDGRTNLNRDVDEMPVFFSDGTVGTSNHGRPRTGQYEPSDRPRGQYEPNDRPRSQYEPNDRARQYKPNDRPRSQYNNSSFKNPPRVNYSQNNWDSPSHQRNSYNPNFNNVRNSQVNDRNSGVDFVYPNQHNANNKMYPLPSISSTIDMQMSNESLKSREQPVYASVNRAGRKSGMGDRNSAHSLPPNVIDFRNSRNTNSYLSPQQTYNSPHRNHNQPTHQSRPQSSQSLDSGFVIGHSPSNLPPPPIRMDRFPSSESETYSEMSRVGEPVPQPPPMPTGNPIAMVRRPHNSTRPASGDLGHNRISSNSQIMDDRNSIEFQPRPRSKTPPATILPKTGPVPERTPVLKKPRQGPPPPPPPRSSLKKPEQSNVTNNTSVPNSHDIRKSNQQDSDQDEINIDDDNDSDTWDVYDDFEFNPGVSYV